MSWKVVYLPEAVKDLAALAGNERMLVAKAITKVSRNPLPERDGGYGKPLGHKANNDLTGFFKIKLKSAGLRIVYTLIRTETEMLIVVIGARADEAVYDAARRRAEKHSL